MRDLKFVIGLIGAFYSLIGFCDTPNQVDLHFTGTVIARPCSISIGATTTLDVGDIDLGKFTTAGATSNWVNYNVRFSACDIQTNIILTTSVQAPLGPYRGFVVYGSNNEINQFMHMDAYATISGKDINLIYQVPLFGLPPIIITPVQREVSDLTSYDVPLKFRFVSDGSSLYAGRYYGVYILSVEYK